MVGQPRCTLCKISLGLWSEASLQSNFAIAQGRQRNWVYLTLVNSFDHHLLRPWTVYDQVQRGDPQGYPERYVIPPTVDQRNQTHRRVCDDHDGQQPRL